MLIKRLIKNSIKIKGLSALCKKQADKFFLIMHHTCDYKLVEFENLKRRCILIEYIYENNVEVHLSPCLELNEHD